METKARELSDINSDGPELSCPYIDGVIKRFPETKNTLEYVREINAQLRHDRDGYAEGVKELQKRVDELEAENLRLVTELINVQIEHPCYRLSKELEAENKKLREALRQVDAIIKIYIGRLPRGWGYSNAEITLKDAVKIALGEVGE